ncbi:MAG: hypothetical protein R3318_05735 [Gammaproteobacteria bacterium]|nr:hypothetical protein [Gammaproteobacteria bacterium]
MNQEQVIDNEGTRTGLYFGFTSGVITTLGLIVGLHSGTHSLTAVVGGIVLIAIADAASDATGIHLSKEADPGASLRTVWLATFATFFSKFVISMTFLPPVLLLPLNTAILVAILWGLVIIITLSFFIARNQQTPALPVIIEHCVITLAVIAISHYVGVWINQTFGQVAL